MKQVKIFAIGKPKESYVAEALSEYSYRLRSELKIEWILSSADEQLEKNVKMQGRLLALDPRGKSLDSEGFAKLVESEIELGGSTLSFVIGGPDGLPESIRANYPLISLSSLTFTNGLVRVVLIEQLYRATQIWRGSPYHR